MDFLYHLDFGAVWGVILGAIGAIGVAWRFVVGGIKAVKASENSANRASLSEKRVSGAIGTLDTLSADVKLLRDMIDELQQERDHLHSNIAQVEAKAKLEKEELELRMVRMEAMHKAQIEADRAEINKLKARLTEVEHDLLKRDGQLSEARQTNLDLAEEIDRLQTNKPKVRKPRIDGLPY